MLRFTLSGLALPLFLLFASPQPSAPKVFGATKKTPASQEQTGTLQKMIVESGSVTTDLDLNRLNGISSAPGRATTLQFAVAINSFFPILVFNELLRGPEPGSMALIPAGVTVSSYSLPAALGASLKQLVVEKLPADSAFDMAVRDAKTGFTFFNIEGPQYDYNATGQLLSIQGGRLLISKEFAATLGRPADAGAVVGKISIGAAMQPIEIQTLVNGETKSAMMPPLPMAASPGTPALVPGPDVIVGDLPSVQQGGNDTVNHFVGLGVGTTSCNNGDQPLDWFALSNTDHPYIPQNLYRMSGGPNNNDRFEQIGQSWGKHAFEALENNVCGFGCNTSGCTTGTHLCPGCSDPYSASLNYQQSQIGSRAWVNPFTGVFPSTANNHSGHSHTGTSHRLTVASSDLNPAQNAGATYFAEGQYITPHEYTWCQQNPGQCNMYNNVSYRQFTVSGSGDSYSFSAAGATVRMRPAIAAWGITGASFNQIEPDSGNDGIWFIAYKVTNPSAGLWHYEYALYNQNLDRAIQSFSVPMGPGVNVTNIGFHAPPQEPGWANDGTFNNQGYSSAPWTVDQSGGAITWACETFAQNQNANAIRFGTLYNFRFDADQPPENADGMVGYFKTGSPTTVAIQGPSGSGSPTPTPTASPSATATATFTPTATATFTPTPTPIGSAPPSPTPTATATPTCLPAGSPGPWTYAAPVEDEHYGGFMDSDGTFGYEGGGYAFYKSDNIDEFGKFDPVANTWTPLAPVPDLNNCMASGVYAPNVNKLFVFGGERVSSATVVDTTRIYDIATNTWSIGAPMPDVRAFMASGYYNGKIYLVSGYSTYSYVTAFLQTWEYDTVANTFAVKTSIPAPAGFGGAGSGVVNGHLYVVGGRDANNTVIATTWDYDIAANTWTARASVPIGVNVPGSAAIGGKLWIFGGGAPVAGSGTMPGSANNGLKAWFNRLLQPDTTDALQLYDPGTNTWSTGPSLNHPRSYPASTHVGNTAVAVGGYSLSGPYITNSVEINVAGGGCASPTPTPTASATPTCTAGGTPGPWTQAAPVPIDHYGGFMDSDGTFAYEGGGYSEDNIDQFGKFDPATNTWTPLAPVPDLNNEEASGVYAPNVNKLFVFGGEQVDSATVVNTTRIYDIATNTWSTGAAMPDVRAFMGSGYFNGKIYLVGGYSTGSVAPSFGQVWEYDPVLNTWDTSRMSMPAALGGPGFGIINGHMYIAGGRDLANTNLNTLYDYDIAANTWTVRANLPSGVNVPGSAVIAGKLWLFGGGNPFSGPGTMPGVGDKAGVRAGLKRLFNPETTNALQVYDPGTDTWSSGPSLNQQRSFPAGTGVGNIAVVVGGYTGTDTTNSVEINVTGGGCGSPTPTPTSTPTATATVTPTATATATPTATVTLTATATATSTPRPSPTPRGAPPPRPRPTPPPRP